MANLILIHEGLTLRTIPLSKPILTIGRKVENDIHLEDAAVSSKHARVEMIASEYLDDHYDVFIEDLGSTNGTVVNGLPVKRLLLKPGDMIQIGKHQFSFDSGEEQDLASTAIYLPDN